VSVVVPSGGEEWKQIVAGKLLNKHQEKTEETRRALLKSARLIFARGGFEA